MEHQIPGEVTVFLVWLKSQAWRDDIVGSLASIAVLADNPDDHEHSKKLRHTAGLRQAPLSSLQAETPSQAAAILAQTMASSCKRKDSKTTALKHAHMATNLALAEYENFRLQCLHNRITHILRNPSDALLTLAQSTFALWCSLGGHDLQAAGDQVLPSQVTCNNPAALVLSTALIFGRCHSNGETALAAEAAATLRRMMFSGCVQAGIPAAAAALAMGDTTTAATLTVISAMQGNPDAIKKIYASQYVHGDIMPALGKAFQIDFKVPTQEVATLLASGECALHAANYALQVAQNDPAAPNIEMFNIARNLLHTALKSNNPDAYATAACLAIAQGNIREALNIASHPTAIHNPLCRGILAANELRGTPLKTLLQENRIESLIEDCNQAFMRGYYSLGTILAKSALAQLPGAPARSQVPYYATAAIALPGGPSPAIAPWSATMPDGTPLQTVAKGRAVKNTPSSGMQWLDAAVTDPFMLLAKTNTSPVTPVNLCRWLLSNLQEATALSSINVGTNTALAHLWYAVYAVPDKRAYFQKPTPWRMIGNSIISLDNECYQK